MYTICNKPHKYNLMLSTYSENQGKTGRHKCAECAMERTMLNTAKGIPVSEDDSILADLPESQAGNLRHKDAYAAYRMIYQ